jgi:hypothetical protein
MKKRLILMVILFLVCSVYTYQSEIRATVTGYSSSASDRLDTHKSTRSKFPYRIINSRYVSRSSLQRTAGQTNGVKIRIMQNGMDNTEIEDFSLAYDSGVQYQVGNIVGIDNANLPLYVKVNYTTWNTFHAVKLDVIYEFVVYFPGTWNVTICN